MSIGGFSQCEKLSECEVANEHRRVLWVDFSSCKINPFFFTHKINM